MKRVKWIGLLLLAACFFLPGCEKQYTTPVTREIFAMDTYMTLSAYGRDAEKAVDAAVEEINRLDRLWSVGDPDSEVSRINRDGGGTISEDTEKVLETALQLYEETDGALDITVYPLMALWGFTGDEQHVPDADALEETLDHVYAGALQFDKASHTLTLGAKQGIDFGAVAKGYTSARVMEIFASYNIDGAIISLGGNVQCMGLKPSSDGSGGKVQWRTGIQRPDYGDGYLGILTLTDKAIITSGGYERYFEENGEVYHHILDPKTGYPAKSGLTSVTIVSADGTLADGLSTSCFILGKDKAIAYWKAHQDAFDMILLTDEGDLLITKPLADAFTSDFDYSIIEP